MEFEGGELEIALSLLDVRFPLLPFEPLPLGDFPVPEVGVVAALRGVLGEAAGTLLVERPPPPLLLPEPPPWPMSLE